MDLQCCEEQAKSISHLVTLDDLVEVTKLRKSWWYAQTRRTGPGTVPRIRCGRYLRFEMAAVMDWLRKTGGRN